MSSLIYMKVLMDYVEGQNKNKTYICLMQDNVSIEMITFLFSLFRSKYFEIIILSSCLYCISEYFDAVAKLHSRHVVSPYFLTAYYILYV